MSSLRDMVTGDVARNLEKIHDSVAKLNDDLRYLRGTDLGELSDEELSLLKKTLDSLATIGILQVILEVTIVKQVKERE